MSTQYTPSRPVIQVSHLPSLAFEHWRELPAIPALYFVVNADLEIVYIGEAGNLQSRWKTHHRAPQMERGGYRIHWKVMPDQARRLEGEKWCINHFRPAWNGSRIPVSSMKRVMAYVNDVAAYRGVDPRELVCQILCDWAYGREGK